MRKLEVSEAQGIIARVYAGHMTVSEIASLSTLVSEAAGGGDGVALEILKEKGGDPRGAGGLGRLEARDA